MKYGILLCTHTLTLSTSAENSSLFFTSINQINKGGPDAVHSPSHRSKLAVLNLKAGKQSIILSDITTAFKLFEQAFRSWWKIVGRYTISSVLICMMRPRKQLVFPKSFRLLNLIQMNWLRMPIALMTAYTVSSDTTLDLVLLYTSTLYHIPLNNSALFIFFCVIQYRPVNCCICSSWSVVA